MLLPRPARLGRRARRRRPISSSCSPMIWHQRSWRLRTEGSSNATPGQARCRRPEVHYGVRRCVDLLPVPGGHHDRARTSTPAPDDLDSRPPRRVLAAAPAPADATATCPSRRSPSRGDLRAAGYAGAMIGKWHLGGTDFNPGNQGFNLSTLVGDDQAKQHRRRQRCVRSSRVRPSVHRGNRNRPFFLYLAHNNPRIPFQSARPASSTPTAQRSSRPMRRQSRRSTTQWDACSRVDAVGLRDRTIVIFTSDNGGLRMPEGPHPRVAYNAPFRAGKGYLYEGGLRMPLMVRGRPGPSADHRGSVR